MVRGPLGDFLARLKCAAPPGDEEEDDALLLRRFATGREEGGFAVLLGRHGPMVLGVCRRQEWYSLGAGRRKTAARRWCRSPLGWVFGPAGVDRWARRPYTLLIVESLSCDSIFREGHGAMISQASIPEWCENAHPFRTISISRPARPRVAGTRFGRPPAR
jgi:hypothetical protein